MSNEKARPIKPEEVTGERLKNFPNEAIEAFNELIARGGGNYVVIGQEEVIALMVKKGLDRNAIFQNHWLDVEDMYRKAGWKVEYDKPGFNESYEATFTFSRSGLSSQRRD